MKITQSMINYLAEMAWYNMIIITKKAYKNIDDVMMMMMTLRCR